MCDLEYTIWLYQQLAIENDHQNSLSSLIKKIHSYVRLPEGIYILCDNTTLVEPK